MDHEQMKEKLTILPPLSVRLTESQSADVADLADLHGMEKGEYIRHLIERDKEKQHAIWLARNPLFNRSPEATKPESDKVIRP